MDGNIKKMMVKDYNSGVIGRRIRLCSWGNRNCGFSNITKSLKWSL